MTADRPETTGLTARLRARAMGREMNSGMFCADMRTAANEIERLRAALIGVLEIEGWSKAHPRYAAARAALRQCLVWTKDGAPVEIVLA